MQIFLGEQPRFHKKLVAKVMERCAKLSLSKLYLGLQEVLRDLISETGEFSRGKEGYVFDDGLGCVQGDIGCTFPKHLQRSGSVRSLETTQRGYPLDKRGGVHPKKRWRKKSFAKEWGS
jgi:hypothetical protein